MELPEAFEIQTKEILGEEYPAFIQALEKESPVSIRINPFKHPGEILFEYEGKVPWASNAYYLNKRPVFTLDPLFHAGTYYVQEASSMYLEQIIRKHITSNVKILDLCAAPGGKSTLLSSLLPEGSFLVANEVIRSRAYILAENLSKWGNPNTLVTNNDPATIGKLRSFFDVIVADVPCSGEGMFRKDPASIREWSTNNVKLCAERQQRIIADIWPALKPGGILVYSTCTYNREENENNINNICEVLEAEIIEPPHRFFPHKTRGEGFFITAIRKTGGKADLSPKSYTSRKERKNKPGKTQKVPEELKSWLAHPSGFSFVQQDNQWIAIPSLHLDTYTEIRSALRLISGGVPLGEIKGKDIIPAHGLAVSTALNLSAFPILPLNKENALLYLSKGVIGCDIFTGIPKGYILITYQNYPLGFVKNIGSRVNNLYPNEWRIRMKV